MEKKNEILTPEEIEEIIRRLEADYLELVNHGQTEPSTEGSGGVTDRT
ncbi:hypothetical protein ACFQWB_02485 [Paenibacillus thermoaerophilus]|uniref:Uncharacterized protein n=1 Tax=Paenibacillus thermoaerophilus TaxID=1215385 RepID=A0ABW2UY57_9BACL|nr:hypothetical protein [Paenibacillus thermoaerophilus]